MNFFTETVKKRLKIVGLGVGSILFPTGSYVAGLLTGREVGFNNALHYATQNGCELVWNLWHEHAKHENVTAVCGESCVKVCISAQHMFHDLVNEYTLGFAVGGFIIGAAFLFSLNITLENSSNNQKDPELQSINTNEVTSYGTNMPGQTSIVVLDDLKVKNNI